MRITNYHPMPDPPIYTDTEDGKVTHKSKPNISFSQITFKVEGKDLGEMKKIWQDTAASETRMNLMAALKSKKVGFREIENFSLGLKYHFKSSKLQTQSDRTTERVVQAAMQVKFNDEKYHHRELKTLKNIKRKKLGELFHPKTHTYKRIIQYLRQEADQVKKLHNEKYRKKVEHLENTYKDTGEKELEHPECMKDLSHLSIFSTVRFEGMQMPSPKPCMKMV